MFETVAKDEAIYSNCFLKFSNMDNNYFGYESVFNYLYLFDYVSF